MAASKQTLSGTHESHLDSTPTAAWVAGIPAAIGSACSFHPLIDEEDFFIFEAVKSFHVAIRERGLLPELHQLLERAREINVAVATSPSYYTNPKAGLVASLSAGSGGAARVLVGQSIAG